jgi:hypothetical protein
MEVYQEGGNIYSFLLRPRFSIMTMILIVLLIILVYLYYTNMEVKQYSDNYINWVKNKSMP